MKDLLNKFKTGCAELLPEEELALHLAMSPSLKIKFGIDPSTSQLHLGHLVPILKLRQLQSLGHRICLLIGDFTATIGDPTGRSQTRPNNLGLGQTTTNGEELLEQIFLFLDKNQTEIYYNKQWYSQLNTPSLLGMLSKFTLSQFLERDDFQKRFNEKKPIHLNEFLYPFFQAYDSVRMGANVEVGGTDQKFNMLLGREVQRQHDHVPQVIMTMPILVGTDGVQKMSKSLNNHINIKDTPLNTLGKIMSLPDEAMTQYFKYILCMTNEEIEKALIETKTPRNAKMFLAMSIVGMLHNSAAALQAHDEFNKRFRDKDFPDEVKKILIDGRKISKLSDLLVTLQAASSKRAARQLIDAKAVHFYEAPEAAREEFIPKGQYKIRVGKKKFYSIQVS